MLAVDHMLGKVPLGSELLALLGGFWKVSGITRLLFQPRDIYSLSPHPTICSLSVTDFLTFFDNRRVFTAPELT